MSVTISVPNTKPVVRRAWVGLECATATCPHCGKGNTFPGFSEVSTYVCAECGKAVAAAGPEAGLEWVEIHDDTCTWYEFGLHGRARDHHRGGWVAMDRSAKQCSG